MKLLSLTVCFIMLLSCGNGSQYQKVFFATKEFPPKLETPFCETLDGFLSQNADKNHDFLIDQLLNSEKTGASYYPIQYTYSDIANHVLSMRYGSLVEYMPEFDYSDRSVNNSLTQYQAKLHDAWNEVLSEENGMKLKKIDCVN